MASTTPFAGRISRLPILILTMLLAVSVTVRAEGEEQAVWTSQADFESGQLQGLDGSSLPGSLQLASVDVWRKSPDNVSLLPGSTGTWDSFVQASSILQEGGVFKMWYSGCEYTTCQIGYATSPDGLNWTRYPGNPILLASVAGWDTSLTFPYVIHDASGYRMWFGGTDIAGKNSSIGYATSLDGIGWTKGASPVFSARPGSWWDDSGVTAPVVLEEADGLTMWYSGLFDATWRIGRAVSTDGISWTRNPLDPVLSASGFWEGSRTFPGAVVRDAIGYTLYYTSGDSTFWLGRARSASGVVWARDPANPQLSEAGSLADLSMADPNGTSGIWYVTATGAFGKAQVGARYSTEGAFDSAAFDAGRTSATWIRLEWTADVPVGTELKLTVSFSLDPARLSWIQKTASGSPPFDLGEWRARVVRVTSVLVTHDDTVSPMLHEIRIIYRFDDSSDPALLGLLGVGIGGGGGAAFGFLLERIRRSRSRSIAAHPP